MVAATALDCVGLSQNQVNDLTAELDELKSVDWPPGLKDEAQACLALECADGSDICISKVVCLNGVIIELDNAGAGVTVSPELVTAASNFCGCYQILDDIPEKCYDFVDDELGFHLPIPDIEAGGDEFCPQLDAGCAYVEGFVEGCAAVSSGDVAGACGAYADELEAALEASGGPAAWDSAAVDPSLLCAAEAASVVLLPPAALVILKGACADAIPAATFEALDSLRLQCAGDFDFLGLPWPSPSPVLAPTSLPTRTFGPTPSPTAADTVRVAASLAFEWAGDLSDPSLPFGAFEASVRMVLGAATGLPDQAVKHFTALVVGTPQPAADQAADQAARVAGLRTSMRTSMRTSTAGGSAGGVAGVAAVAEPSEVASAVRRAAELATAAGPGGRHASAAAANASAGAGRFLTQAVAVSFEYVASLGADTGLTSLPDLAASVDAALSSPDFGPALDAGLAGLASPGGSTGEEPAVASCCTVQVRAVTHAPSPSPTPPPSRLPSPSPSHAPSPGPAKPSPSPTTASPTASTAASAGAGGAGSKGDPGLSVASALALFLLAPALFGTVWCARWVHRKQEARLRAQLDGLAGKKRAQKKGESNSADSVGVELGSFGQRGDSEGRADPPKKKISEGNLYSHVPSPFHSGSTESEIPAMMSQVGSAEGLDPPEESQTQWV